MAPEQADRALGALLGLAVGDALGTTLEFSRRDERPLHSEMTGGGPFGLAPGQWTDDTAMAIALGDSLVARGRLDARDVMRRFTSWWRDGEYSCTGECFDIGGTTRSALGYYERTGKADAGSEAADTAGNGSIMRLAPAVLHGLLSEDVAVATARGQSRTTHGAPACLDACEVMARIMRDLVLRPPGDAPRYRIDG
jgi:ADP-ribosyl-[dinitrogen reductase] hydrolase